MQSDIFMKGRVSIKKFAQTLSTYNVALTNEEIRRLAILSNSEDGINTSDFGANNSSASKIDTAVNYMQLSRNLGLHKASFNLINNAASTSHNSPGSDSSRRCFKISMGRKSPIMLKKFPDALQRRGAVEKSASSSLASTGRKVKVPRNMDVNESRST